MEISVLSQREKKVYGYRMCLSSFVTLLAIKKKSYTLLITARARDTTYSQYTDVIESYNFIL